MLIAVDAREMAGRPTGVGRYLENILREWAASPAAASHRFIVYAPEPVPLPPGLQADMRVLGGAPGTWWEQVRLARAVGRDRPDVVFAPAYSAPIAARVPVVLTVHDVSFLAHPEWFSPRERLRRALTTKMAARRARIVLTVSEFSRGEITRFLGVPAERIRVVRNGVDRSLGSAARAGAGDGAVVAAADPLVLYVGSIFNRRRLPQLIAAFGLVAASVPDARLEIAGENRTHPRQDLAALAQQTKAASRISIRSYVSDEELAALYSDARVFVFLSEYEGFGLTPLEALSCGVPLVVLDTPVAREIYQGAAVRVQPDDIEGTAAAIRSLIEEGPVRREVLAEAPRVLASYTWTKAAHETLAALVEAAGGA